MVTQAGEVRRHGPRSQRSPGCGDACPRRWHARGACGRSGIGPAPVAPYLYGLSGEPGLDGWWCGGLWGAAGVVVRADAQPYLGPRSGVVRIGDMMVDGV